MKKLILSPLSLAAAMGTATFLLAACGDTFENVNQTGVELFSSEEDLPECTGKNEGDLAVVKGESSLRVCMDGEWTAMASEGSGVEGDFSCTTKELKDGSGLKIICNGDSIGVVLNGSDGKAGKDGKDGADGEDGKDAVLPNDTLESDSERVPVSLDSLAGFSQKGPFLKGSTVYLYELSDGRTLKQTNGNFTSYITRDDGRYKFSARDLASQYAMIVVEGNYRNEVTGEPSNAPIRLRALTDMRKRSDANINLLTTLEFDRVYHLVTRGDSTGKKLTVKQAKKQAQAEIFKAFDIDTTGFKGSAEDLDVFGATDADAALLAISVMLQGDGSETDLSVLLTEIASDMETDGTWDNASAKARLADWIAVADADGRLGQFRKNVAGWKLSDTVPVFEKFVRNYYSIENKLGKCGDKDIPVGTVMNVKNPKSIYYAKEYSDTTSRVRFICLNADSARWRVATEIEKDTADLGHDFAEGDVIHGRVNKDFMYVYQDGNWRHGTALDSAVGEGCRPSLDDTVVLGKDSVWYKCIGDSAMTFEHNDLIESAWDGAWRMASALERDTNGLGHEFSDGAVHRGVVDTSLVYVYEDGNWVTGTAMDDSVGTGCVLSLSGKIFTGRDGETYICNVDYSHGIVRTWSKAPDIVKDTTGWGRNYSEGAVRFGKVNTTQAYVFESGAWRVGSQLEGALGIGCVRDGDTSSVKYDNVYYVCKIETLTGSSNHVWRVAPDIYNDTYENRSRCKNNGTYSDGRIVYGRVNTSYKYICDAGEYREATSFEKILSLGCVNKTRNYIYKIDETFYKCQTGGWGSVTTRARGIMKDRDGDEYETVVIGTQQWMAKNLNYAMDSTSCYEGESSNCFTYGRQYSKDAAGNACPYGWRLPTKNDWTTLIFFVGESCDHIEDCDEAGNALKSQSGWTYNSSTRNGADAYGFTVLPAGRSYHYKKKESAYTIEYRYHYDMTASAHFWATGSNVVTFEGNNDVAINVLQLDSIYKSSTKETFFDYRFSVRCIQDN